jgi:hypothetical protein
LRLHQEYLSFFRIIFFSYFLLFPCCFSFLFSLFFYFTIFLKSWCERWNIKINEGKTQAIYFFRRLRFPEDMLHLNGRDIPFVNTATYLGVTFERRMTWRLHIERTVAKALCTYIKTYFIFKSERLRTDIKLTLYKAPIRSVMTHACPTCEYAVDVHLLKLQRLQNSSPRYWEF